MIKIYNKMVGAVRMYKLVILMCFALSGFSQTVLNSSFEDSPSDATTPKAWFGCQESTTPDILPGFWGEYRDAYHGNTYVGLITRENGTYESLGQRLSKAVVKNDCHKFSIMLAHGKVYSGYNKPLKLRVWLGHSKCDKGQMIYESTSINNKEWQKFNIQFTPKEAYQYIIFEAFYKEGKFSYKGNILLDHMSSIVLCGRV